MASIEAGGGQALAEAALKAQAMIRDLGQGYRPKAALQSVFAFQRAFNAVFPDIASVVPQKTLRSYPCCSRGRPIMLLGVDGLYGPRTGCAATLMVNTALKALGSSVRLNLPCYAKDMPTWFVGNRDTVAMISPPKSPPQPIPPGPKLPPNSGQPQAEVAADLTSGRARSSTLIDVGEVSVGETVETPAGRMASGRTGPAVKTPPAPVVKAPRKLPPLAIPTLRPRTPKISPETVAIVAGVGVAAGVVGWWGYKQGWFTKRRRRRRR